MDSDLLGVLTFGVLVGIFIFALFFGLVVQNNGIQLKQSTGNEICAKITNNSVAVAEEGRDCNWAGNCNLVCKIPSYDHTQEIIIKSNNEK